MARRALREVGVEGRRGEAHERSAPLGERDAGALDRDQAFGAQRLQGLDLPGEIDGEARRAPARYLCANISWTRRKRSSAELRVDINVIAGCRVGGQSSRDRITIILM